MVHLQRLQEDDPEPALHHSEAKLNNGACPGVMAVEALGYTLAAAVCRE